MIYLIALIPLGVGIAHIIKGWKASFEKYFEADDEVMRYVRPVSRFGLIARGVFIDTIGLRHFARIDPGLVTDRQTGGMCGK
ncbi:hypothetical protein, partial [Streptomyces griseorubiginosus]|uniref:hypothetical protein n=1 Tax=Streptomyces griseorubiginosus TaxID=67304 RepID=UPI00341C3304